jgi:STE24 endopeptidase
LIFKGFFGIVDKPLCLTRVSAAAVTPPQPASRPKAYNRVKLILGITSSVLTFTLLVFILGSGLSRSLADWALATTGHTYPALFLFAVTIGLLQSLVTLPFGFASGYWVEHHFGLSRQTLPRWAWERFKGSLVGAPIAALVVAGLYASLETWGELWWIPVGIMLTVLSVLLTAIAPVFLFPLFYRFTPVEDGALKTRLL